MTDRVDVVAVEIETGVVRVLAKDKIVANAESIVRVTIYRRGVETEFYAAAPAGRYHDGDHWEGEAVDVESRIRRSVVNERALEALKPPEAS